MLLADPTSPDAKQHDLGSTSMPANGTTRWPALPKAPVLGWSDILPAPGPAWPAVDGLRYRVHTTSGRAALAAALSQAALPVGTNVLVPTYHCPTMIAPVVRAGLAPVYFPIGDDGLPRLDAIEPADAAAGRVMFCAHYFGLAKSLRSVRDWCDSRGILLVEDCAHSFFGRAGERDVGQWGDFATASLSKFFPISEGGMLTSATRPLLPLGLAPATPRAQIKAVVDVFELARLHGRLTGLSQLAAPLLWAKNRGRNTPLRETQPEAAALDEPPADAQAMMDECRMERIGEAPTGVNTLLAASLPRMRLIHRRRANYEWLARTLPGSDGVRPLTPALPDGCVPYAFPLFVEDAVRADAIYAAVRQARLPVFRWDRVWPGTPDASDDTGRRWTRRTLQLLCHQSLSAEDMARFTQALQHIVRLH